MDASQFLDFQPPFLNIPPAIDPSAQYPSSIDRRAGNIHVHQWGDTLQIGKVRTIGEIGIQP
jgi:hypothetical protein